MKFRLRKLDSSAKSAVNLAMVSGTFWFSWAFGCYLSVYLQEKGFSASQLGILNASCNAVMIAAISFWGMVSDKIGSVKKIILLNLVVGFALFAFIPMLKESAIYSVPILIAYVAFMSFFRGPVPSFIDNLAVRSCTEQGLNFGVIRGGGSMFFVIGSMIISFIIPSIGVESSFWLSALLAIPVVFFVIFAKEPSLPSTAFKGAKKKLNVGALFKNYYYTTFLCFAFIFYLGVSCEGSFLAFFMNDVGIDAEKIGIVLAYRALSEVPFLFLSVKLRRKFKLEHLIIAAALLMGAEGVFFGLFTNSLGTMLLFSTFFGIGNGIFISAGLTYVYQLAPENLKASGQAFFAATASIAGIIGNLVGGRLYDGLGTTIYYLIVACLFVMSSAIFTVTLNIKKKTPA